MKITILVFLLIISGCLAYSQIGVKTSDVEAVAFFLKLNPVNAFMVPKPYLLFKDGMICDCAEIPLQDLDLIKIRLDDPKDLGKWRRIGKKYEVL
ncbi:MAG: hypothetical protein ACR2MX_16985 [Cyclobacteriaceae bacterium]